MKRFLSYRPSLIIITFNATQCYLCLLGFQCTISIRFSTSDGEYSLEAQPARVNSDKRHGPRQRVKWNPTRDNLPRPNCDRDGKADNKRQAFINTDTRRFKIQMADMDPPPPGRASPYNGHGGSTQKGYLFQALGIWKCGQSTGWSIWKGRKTCHFAL